MGKPRHFSNDFKLQVVQEYESGNFSLMALCKKYDLHRSVIFSWCKNFRSGQLLDNSVEIKRKDKEIKELREMVGKQALEIDFLKRSVRLKRSKKNGFSSIISGPAITLSEKDVR